MGTNEREERLKEAIESLPNKQREVLLMRVYEELEYEEIARRLGCPVGTVKSRIHNGTNALKIKLKKAGLPRNKGQMLEINRQVS